MHNKRVVRSVLFGLSVLTSLSYAEYDNYGYDPMFDAPPPPRDRYAEPKRTIPAKQVIIQNRKSITALKRKVTNLEERIDGLTSLIEGLNITIAELRRGTMHPAALPQNSDNTALIKELGVMIDRINDTYVTKDELQDMLKGQKLSSKRKHSKRTNTSSATSGANFASKPTSKIYSEGVRLFVKQRYAEAEKRFMLTAKKGYKPAASNYYLGEIAYYTKKYEDAIFYYKKSASLYDQASYIDVLLLHTAISLQKTGDKNQARSFYQNIIDNYPDKKTAKIARDKLKKL